MQRPSTLLRACVAFALAGAASLACADCPERPVQVIVHFAAGGGLDLNARTFSHVPYKGDGPMLQDVLAGRLGFGAMLASSVASQLQAGTLRLLAVYADRRHPNYPAVPTLTEAGVPVIAYQPGAPFAQRLRQDSDAKAATLKRLGL